MTTDVVDGFEEPREPAWPRMASWAAPVALLVLLVAALLYANPSARLGEGAPPVEALAFEGVRLEEGMIVLHVRNLAAEPVTIAQVLVDDAYWLHEVEPSPTLARYGRATVTVHYPWVEGEPHVVILLTGTGTPFEHEIAVATATPAPSARAALDYGLLGLLVGVLPVAAGMALLPVMRRLPAKRNQAVLAFTLGLLAFLGLDTLEDGLELSEAAPVGGLGLFAGAAVLAILAVLALERVVGGRGRAAGATLALLVAVGIGLHNLGEGLLIGSAFALGSVGLGTALVTGFAVHNVTEGPAIVGPLAQDGRQRWTRYVLLALVAGLPTVAGAWLGAFTSSGVLPVVFFGLGLGAIVVVLLQVGAHLQRSGRLASTPNVAAFALGYVLMLATSLLAAA